MARRHSPSLFPCSCLASSPLELFLRLPIRSWPLIRLQRRKELWCTCSLVRTPITASQRGPNRLPLLEARSRFSWPECVLLRFITCAPLFNSKTGHKRSMPIMSSPPERCPPIGSQPSPSNNSRILLLTPALNCSTWCIQVQEPSSQPWLRTCPEMSSG